MTEQNITYKNMADYTVGECGFSVFHYMNTWAWCVLPNVIIETDKYVLNDKSYTLNEMIPKNVYTHDASKKEVKTEDVVEELLKKGFRYSEKLTCHLNETGYNVVWFH